MTSTIRKENKTPEILFFSSNYCEPCKEVEKLIHKINISMFGKKIKDSENQH